MMAPPMAPPPVPVAAAAVDDDVTTQIAASAAVSEAPALEQSQSFMAYDQASEAPSMAYSAAPPMVLSGVPTPTSFAAPAPAMLPVHVLAPDLFNGQVQFKFTADPAAAGPAETEAPPATRDVTVKKKRGCC